MTSAPVPLAEQSTTDLQFVERHLRRCENEWKKVYPPHEQDDIDREIASFRRVLSTLQKYERATAALRQIAEGNVSPRDPVASMQAIARNALAGDIK
jgi:hypothetical protein